MILIVFMLLTTEYYIDNDQLSKNDDDFDVDIGVDDDDGGDDCRCSCWENRVD